MVSYNLRKYKKSQKSEAKTIDTKFLSLILLLTGIGLVALANASSPMALANFSDKFYFVKQQTVWGLVGLIMLIIFANVNYKFWQKIAVPLFVVGILFLTLVFIPGLGESVLGAKRRVNFGPIGVQPAEFMKLILAVYLAKVASSNKKTTAFLVPLGLVALLIMLQPDLGTTIVLMTIGFTQIFVAGVSLTAVFGSLMAGALAALLLIITSEYRKDRLMTFLQIGSDPLGKSYHARQVLLTLGSGGLFGVGLGHSTQKYFLPETATDSIFAIIAEETGFIGASIIILLFTLYILKGTKIAQNAPDVFSKVLSAGIVGWVGGQAFLNIAAMTVVVPLTGIPLPFISYGGSSLVSIFIANGILLNIARYTTNEKRK
jgi:cell division protein FtsW